MLPNQECLKMNNFNSLLEILSGINNYSVQRLKKTWKALPSKFREKFSEMEELMDNRLNYANYRKKLAECSKDASVLPYFGFFCPVSHVFGFYLIFFLL